MRPKNFFISVVLSAAVAVSSPYGAEKRVWKPVEFAIVRFNDDAPASWNIYHGEKRGVLLVRLWKRYMLVDVKEQEVYDDAPKKKPHEGNEEGSPPAISDHPVDTTAGKNRDDVPTMRL